MKQLVLKTIDLKAGSFLNCSRAGCALSLPWPTQWQAVWHHHFLKPPFIYKYQCIFEELKIKDIIKKHYLELQPPLLPWQEWGHPTLQSRMLVFLTECTDNLLHGLLCAQILVRDSFPTASLESVAYLWSPFITP